MDLFRKALWSNSHLCCLEISSSVHRLAVAVQSTWKHLTEISGHQNRWLNLVGTARPQLSQVNKEGRGGMPGELLSCDSLREEKIGEDSMGQLSSASATIHHSSFYLYPPTSRVLPGPCLSSSLTSARAAVSTDITLPISLSSQKQQETAAHHQKLFVHICL